MNLSKILNLTRIIYTVFGIVYLTSGILINCIQFLLFIFLKPFSEYFFRKCNYYLSYSLYSPGDRKNTVIIRNESEISECVNKGGALMPQKILNFDKMVFLQQYWANVRVTLHAKRNDYFNHFGKEPAFLIMNHSYEIDWMIGWILCDGCRILGNVKTFAKKSLQYLPTLGYSWKLGGSIFVERNWQKDQKVFERKLRELATYKDPIWLLLAAEGTRFTKEKHEASKVFAREHALPQLLHHLTPRTKGFTTSIPILRNNMAAVYNVNVGVKPGSVRPTLTSILHGKSINADFYVERFPMKDLPESEADLTVWLHSLYKRKDDLIHSYLTTGNWKVTSDAKQYESFLLPRRIFPAINFGCWFVCVVLPLGSFLIKLIASGSLLSLATAAGIIGSFVYLLDKLVGETQISKASSYGIAKDQINNKGLKN